MGHRFRIFPRTAHVVATFLFVANLVVETQANESSTSLAPVERLSTLGGMCFDSTLSDEAALRDFRRQIVKFNQKRRYVGNVYYVLIDAGSQSM